MATINVGTHGGGKKSVDADIPLVPFIDLLLCCVMFLLVTAVWNELASMQVTQQLPGESSPDMIDRDSLGLTVLLNRAGYVVASTAGDQIAIPRIGEELDFGGLRERLALYQNAHPSVHDITLAPDDGIAYEAVIATMDVAHATGFSAIAL